MIAHPEDSPAVAADHPDRIVRLIRRICLLREQGQASEATRLEAAELAPALDAARAAGGAEGLTLDTLEKLYAVEADRAANAAVLAELIVMHLKKTFPAADLVDRIVTTTATASPPPAPQAGPAPGGSPAIPDLLDAMLAHDRSAARRRMAPVLPGPGFTEKQKSHQK